MNGGRDDFAASFEALTGFLPFRWQTRLFERLSQGRLPSRCSLPTGMGKTSVMPIWLIALAQGAKLPRRLVYIVNRRTVVDQATEAAENVLARLRQSGRQCERSWAVSDPIKCLNLKEALHADHVAEMLRLGDALAALAGDLPRPPLTVSALRGELADNEEWKEDPARAAIIVGTVDMIGSKLLFSGFGDGRHARAHHAGLIGQDALIVHDEAHLEPAFDALLNAVQQAQRQEGGMTARNVRVMRLSATSRSAVAGAEADSEVLGIDDEDRRDPVVRQRLSANKRLEIVKANNAKAVETIAEKAVELGGTDSRVLVYVRTPGTARDVRAAIINRLRLDQSAGSALQDGEAQKRVGLLTGTLRGHERDELARSEVFRTFQAIGNRETKPAHAVFLVSTSAGEVGADWDADHLVCDLTTLDSMIQRCGRVNRLGGEGRKAKIVVVMEGGGATDTSGRKARGGADSGARSVRGEGEEGEATGAGESARKRRSANKYEAAIEQTGELLTRITEKGGDVSPEGLQEFIRHLSAHEIAAAFSPPPTILKATDVLFDHWSLTSIGMVNGPDGRWRDALPGRPAVEPYLHGVAEWEPPETHLAWRADIALLARAGGADAEGQSTPCSDDDLEVVLDAFPLRSAETLRDRTDRVQGELMKIAKRLRNEAKMSRNPVDASGSIESDDASARETIDVNPWVVVTRRGEATWERLRDLAPFETDGTKQNKKDSWRRLAFATVVLPVEAGGLRDGMLDGEAPAPMDPRTLDVAEALSGGSRDRRRILVRGGTVKAVLGDESIVGDCMACVILSAGEQPEGEPERLEYRVARGRAPGPVARMPLDDHNNAVGKAAERMAAALELDERVRGALHLAGTLHDAGKSRAVWQRFARNASGSEPIAKSERNAHWRMLGGYRHEFGSLHTAAADDEIRSLDPDTRDLVLHLIAAHHGWGRPHFEPRHFDPGDPHQPRRTADNQRIAAEALRRFPRLQRRYGRWGLAWLESILRCADVETSRMTTVPRSTDRLVTIVHENAGEQ